MWHTVSETHTAVVQQLQQYVASSTISSFEAIQHKENQLNDGHLEATANMIRIIFVETKNNVDLSAHSYFVNLMKLGGMNVGLHQRTEVEALEMRAFLHQKMKIFLIERLIKNYRPLSLIIDRISHFLNGDYLLMYIQTVEDASPVIYFYRAFYLTETDNVKSILNQFENEWRSDQIMGMIQKQLIGVTIRDGEVSRDLANAIERFVSSAPMRTMSKVYKSFFVPHQSIHITSDADEIIINFELNLCSAIRRLAVFCRFIPNVYCPWNFYLQVDKLVSNRQMNALDFTVLRLLLENWNSMVKALDRVAKDKSYLPRIQLEAQNLSSLLKTRQFLALIAFMTDVLHILNKLSLSLDQRESVIIDSERIVRELSDAINLAETVNGAYISEFLQKTVCRQSDKTIPCKTFNNFYRSQVVTYYGYELIDNKMLEWPTLTDFRPKMIKHIKNYLTEIFPNARDLPFRHFDVFKPNECTSTSTHYEYSLSKISDFFFNWTPNKIDFVVRFWALMTGNVQMSHRFCELKSTSSAVTFWSQILLTNEFQIDSYTTSLLHVVLSIPFGGAEITLGATALNEINEKLKVSQTLFDVNEILMIRCNGPKNIETFPAAKYAALWIEASHVQTDDPAAVVQPNHNYDNERKQFLPESNIF